MTEPIAEPGLERDAQVAVEVFGWKLCQQPIIAQGVDFYWQGPGGIHYAVRSWSTDDRECVAVLLEMQRRGWSYGTGFNNGNPPFQWAMFERDGQGYRADADTLAAAVTAAALRAVRAQGGEHDRA